MENVRRSLRFGSGSSKLESYFLHYLIASLLGALVAACGASGPVEKPVTSSAPSRQNTPEPIEIKKPLNVSFSTYSEDWPVDWQWIDPDESLDPTPHDVKKGVLRISIRSKKELHGSNRSAPRYLKAIKGDFQIETRVKFSPKENYQGAGLLIFWNDTSYLRFERAYGGPGGGGEGIRLDTREGNEHRTIATPNDLPTEAYEVELKIVRSGETFVALWRDDEEHEWREAGEYQSHYPESVLVGITVENTARPVTAEFVYITLRPVAGNSVQ
jgi:beta-xylosidase